MRSTKIILIGLLLLPTWGCSAAMYNAMVSASVERIFSTGDWTWADNWEREKWYDTHMRGKDRSDRD